MNDRAEGLIPRLEAEIAERDARIAELEAQAGEGTSSNKYRAELYDEVWQAARDMGYGNVTGALQELAALKAQQPSVGGAYSSDPLACSGCAAGCFRCRSSAGVVLPEPLKRGDEGGSGEYGAAMIRGFNACLREVARLNPCRAQAVPDGWVMVPVEPTGEMEQFICNCDVRNGAITGDYPEWQQCYKAMLAAAPSAKKESGDE